MRACAFVQTMQQRVQEPKEEPIKTKQKQVSVTYLHGGVFGCKAFAAEMIPGTILPAKQVNRFSLGFRDQLEQRG